MNPNSKNQIWSRWKFTVTPGTIRDRSYREIKENVARFARKGFGSASEMRISRDGAKWIFEIRSEGHPVHDPGYRDYILKSFVRFFTNGFGVGTETRLEAKLEAGSRQDGTPSDQLLILPQISLTGAHHG